MPRCNVMDPPARAKAAAPRVGDQELDEKSGERSSAVVNRRGMGMDFNPPPKAM